MKVVHCIFTMNTGGAQVLIVDLLNLWFSKGIDVSLIIVNNEKSDIILGKLNKNIPVYNIERKQGSKNPFTVLRLNLLIQRLKPDIIHCHEPNMINFFLIKNFKLVFTVHDVGKIIPKIKKYNKIIAISEAVAKDFTERYGFAIPFINNGIQISSFHQRTSHEFPGNRIRLVQLSRLMHEKKGQDILIKSIALLKEKHKDYSISLDFIGNGNSLSYLEELTSSLQLNDNINFIGEKDRLWINENLCSYHMLVQPSIYEGFGLTVTEGIAAKIPVVASNIEGPSEILNFLDCPYLFERGNPADCAHAISQVIEAYKNGKIPSQIENSYKKLNHQYSIEATAASYFTVYKEALN